MKLLRVSYEHFRNLSRVSLAPSARTTVAVGENGQGKTNLLEGLYCLATLKPLRAARTVELVEFGAESARVSGRFELNGAEREIAVELSSEGRTAAVDGKPATTLEAYFGGVSVVAFTPDDLAIVKGGPDGRRAFLDRCAFNRFPAYLGESRAYLRALKGRNRLVRDAAPRTLLAAWDETLARAGARIWARRRATLAELAPRAADTFARITRGPLRAGFAYRAARLHERADGVDLGTASEPELAAALMAALAERLPRDTERGFTSVGPHADDVLITLGEHPARAYASQGQCRALVIAWKIGEIENLHSVNGFLPLLLLDDVSSELDPERNAFLMGYLQASGAQTFLTTTDPSLVAAAAGDDTAWYRVRAGTVQPESRESVQKAERPPPP